MINIWGYEESSTLSCFSLDGGGILFITGCTTTYKAVGSFNDYNETFIGEVSHNLMGGGATFVVETQNSKIRCDGVAYKPDYTPQIYALFAQMDS